jgi:hypothetical protein
MEQEYNMSERQSHGHEQAGEHHINIVEAKKHQERIKVRHEKAAESDHNNQHEQLKARHEVKAEAISGAEYSKPQSEKRQPTPVTTKKDKERSFNTIMHQAQSQMSKPERAFSQFIHKPVVEKTSEAIGKTIARPSGIAGATIAAFIGLLSVYSVAKFAGFQLSGSEMPLLMLAGFTLGLFVEWAYKAARSVVTNS